MPTHSSDDTAGKRPEAMESPDTHGLGAPETRETRDSPDARDVHDHRDAIDALGATAPRSLREAPAATTPMFRQYLAAKEQHRDAILLFRMGDFYAMFFEDALVASRALELALTARGRGTAAEAPMCGVPAHAADSYIARLVRLGHRVAICEQTEDPKVARGLVSREVVRVVSPGTMTDPGSLEARAALYIASLTMARDGVGLAFADLSTGEFLAWDGDPARAREVLAGYSPREIVHAEDHIPGETLLGDLQGSSSLLSPRPGWTFADHSARKTLMDHFRVATVD